MLKTKKIIDILKAGSKYSNTIDMVTEIKNILQIDFIQFDQFLEKLNSREINAYDLVQIEGFFSEFGCIELPMTFSKFRVINEGITYMPNQQGVLERVQKTSITTPLLPSIYPDDVDDHKIGFLYPTHKRNFEIGISEKQSIQIEERNKFIPFLIDTERYYKYCQKYVRMVCQVVPLNEKMTDNLLGINDPELKEIIGYFNNNYYPFITSYILICKHIEFIDQENLELNRTIWFSIEYEVSNSDISYQIISSKFAKAYKKTNGYNLPVNFQNEDVQVWCDNKDGIQTLLKDNYIGFYKEVHPDNSSEYRDDMELIEKYIIEFLSVMKLKCTLSFISDYRRKKIYESIVKR